MTRSICAVFLLALAPPAFAQVNPQFADVSDEIEMVRSLVRIERKAAVEQAMQLAPAESQAFWTIYNEYEAERTKINDRTVKVITDYAAAYPDVGDERAETLLDEAFDVDADHAEPEKEVRAAFRQGHVARSRGAVLSDRAQAGRGAEPEHRRADPADRPVVAGTSSILDARPSRVGALLCVGGKR